MLYTLKSLKFKCLHKFKWIFLYQNIQVKKASYGEVCTTCDNTLGLSCDAGNYCTCSLSNYFWNGTYCGMFLFCDAFLRLHFSYFIMFYIFNLIVQTITDGTSCANSWDCDTTKGLWCGNVTNSIIYKKCV